jgi:dihydrodipicolinate synthase/N-acetylneuraminate lyase
MNQQESSSRYPRGIMGTVCIPWDSTFTIQEDTFRRAIAQCEKLTGLLYIGGTAGEGYALDRERFVDVLRIFLDQVSRAPDCAAAGIISTSVYELKKRIEIAGNVGFSCVQISLPCWVPPTGDEIISFFDDILSAFPEMKFMHYNRSVAGVYVQASQYKEICAMHGNLVAAKIVTDSIREVDRLMQEQLPLELFFTNASFAYASMQGPCSLLAAIETLSHSFAREYFHAAQQRECKKLFSMNRSIRSLTSYLVSLYKNGAHIDGAFDKLYHKHADRSFPLRLLPPYRGADDHIFSAFERCIDECYPEFRY